MQVIKPQRIAVLFRPYEHLQRFHLAVTAVLYFPFAQPDYLLPEIAMWKRVAEELGKDAVFDMCMPKPNAEALVVGKCYAPGGTPVTRSTVALTLGPPDKPLIDKRLNVFGERLWQRRVTGIAASEPAPFSDMPIDFTRAFGGPNTPHNPLGKGDAPSPPAGDGSVAHRLPNVEDAKFPIVSPDDKPPPASFSPVDFTWPQRASRAGTYDGKWLKERFPGYADDMDAAIFNAAPPDQWIAGFFRGDEAFAITGMHPEQRVVQGTLPGAAMRCFVNQNTAEGPQLREVGMRAETLWLFPRVERAALVFRGVVGIATDDAADITDLLVAAESLDEPRSVDYYQGIRELRLDPREGALHALSDGQLLPTLPVRRVPFPDDNGADDWMFTPKGLQRKRIMRKAEVELERTKVRLGEMRVQLVESRQRLEGLKQGAPDAAVLASIAGAAEAIDAKVAGIDTTLAYKLPPDPPPVSLEELPALKKKLLDEARVMEADSKLKLAAAEQSVRESLASTGKRSSELREQAIKSGATAEQLAKIPAAPPDLDALKAQARRDAGGPPKPFAQAAIDKLRAAQAELDAIATRFDGATGPAQAATIDAATAKARVAADDLRAKMPKLEQQLFEGERQQMQMYRKNAHMMLPAPALDGPASRLARDRVAAARAAGQSLAGADFTGADLSGLDLKGMDLRDALLEGADFGGADLSGANLSGAVLARANLRKANLTGVKAAAANLGFAEFSDADATGADFSGATLANARMQRAKFSGAKMDRADLLGAQLAGADLSGVSAPGTNFINVDLAMPAEPPEIGVEPVPGPDLDMRGVRFGGANLEKSNFINCIVEGSDFGGANLAGIAFVAAKGDGCSFRGANLSGARFVMASSFADCDFSGALIDKASLRGARLANGNFIGCSARQTDFSEADLSRAKFGKALARGARFAKADLTLADMQGINLVDGVLQKAILHGTQLQGANLFGADLLRIKVDNGTDLGRANLQRTLAGAVDKK